MIEILSPQETSWLERFFSGRNALKWEEVVSRSANPAWLEQVQPWITMFSGAKEELPIVLPVFNASGPCQWYGMSSNESGANALCQELLAFVGPSFSSFRGLTITPDADDPIEQALVDRFGKFVYRLEPVNAENILNIVDALQLYLNLLRRRPEIPDRSQRPFGKVRAEFDQALLAGSESDAARLREELISSGRVDAEQEKYLHIRMLAGLGQHFQLAHDYPLVKSVLGLSLPTQILSDLVEALYLTYIDDLEERSDDKTILEAFKKEISDNFGALFLERKGITNPRVLKAFFLYELVQSQPNHERCRAILSVYPEGKGRRLVERWMELLAVDNSPSDLVELARQAVMDEDYELALQAGFDALPASWTYSTLIRCAAEIGDIEIARRVLEVVDHATDDVRGGWAKRDKDRIERLRVEVQRVESGSDQKAVHIRPDADWLSWADYVEFGNGDCPALQILEDALPKWSVEVFASNASSCRELANRIGNSTGLAEQTFRDAFAPLVEFFVDRPEQPIRAFAPLYVMLIRIVAWNGAVTANELELASAVLQALTNLAPSKDDYVEAVDAFTEILHSNRAPAHLDWALNTAEMLALQSSSNPESRLRFFVAVVDMARECSHRLSLVQYELLTLLAKDYGCPEVLASFPSRTNDEQDQPSNTSFSGLIGIYTLMEPAGQRAQQFLQKRFPQARVVVNADHVATDKLKTLAASADIFVFAWKSSKHQAYFAAKDARGSRPTLLPLGKGSASILECVLGALAH
ncbi:hypothetical protein GWQ43_05590 [Alcaligenes faecalis]|uniref:protein DpdD n=1 Tax=Alcaligenes faecalis TaxID=511 RepID=UPI00137C0CF8|nr:protein DpdD [Alcaligenes faecalis]QHS35580.1 hypothetical protein GWQ43_05590 [Alcaligenes faecalis]